MDAKCASMIAHILLSNSSNLCMHVENRVITNDMCTYDISAHELKCPTNKIVTTPQYADRWPKHVHMSLACSYSIVT